MALEGVIAQCYPIALLLVTHSVPKKITESDFLYYCAIGYAMTAFEQAWTLLKSIQSAGPPNFIQKDPDWSNPNNEEMIANPNYYWDDFFNSWFEAGNTTSSNQRPPVRNDLRFDIQTMLPIEGAKGFDIDAFRSRKLPTPLEERVADRPPVSHIEWNPNTNKYTLRGTGDEALSTLIPGMPMGQSPFPEGSTALHSIHGVTPKQFRRKDYYRKLLTGLINAGIDIYSDDRNRQSNPFHQKFIDNLPPNIQAIRDSDASGKIGYFDPIHYRRYLRIPKLNTDFYNEMQERARRNNPERAIRMSDLARRDYGALPIRTIPYKDPRDPSYKPPYIGTRQTKLDEFRPPPPPPPPPPPEGHIFQQLLGGI